MSAINGHQLPTCLERLALNGVWGPPHRSPLPLFEGELQLLDVAGMERNTQVLRDALASGSGVIFGLSSQPGDGLLDPGRVVVIAATIDEEALALDYSSGSPPRVVATGYGSSGVRWVEIAPSFEELAAGLGLI